MKMRIFNLILIFLCSYFIISCTKNEVNLLDENNKSVYLDAANSANIKVIDVFAGNTPVLPTAFNLAYTGPQLFIYANSTKLNGTPLGYINGTSFATPTSTAPNALGQAFPIPNIYANIPSVATRFDIVLARLNLAVVPNVPAPIAGDTLITANTTLGAGKYYSLYIGDTIPTYKLTVKEDDLSSPPAYQTYKVRLANFLMDPLENITLFSRRQNAEIITNVTHKNVSDWIQLPLPVISDTLEIRKTGTPTTYITVQGTASQAASFLATGMRMYTVVARGKAGLTGKLPSASIIVNR